MYFEATPESNGLLFGIHGLAFVTLGTIWFYVFGQPSLVGWLGDASRKTLDRERIKFNNERFKTGC